MLNEDVIRAVENGQFHIYPVKTIDEGLEILTGVKAGEKQKDGSFEEGTVNYQVDKELERLAQAWHEFEGRSEEEKRAESE